MINGFNLYRLRYSEFMQFIKDVLTIVGIYSPQALLVVDEYELLKSSHNQASELLTKESSNALSEELAALDDERDSLFQGLRLSVEAAMHHPEASTQDQARVLISYLDAHCKGVTRENYPSETHVLAQLNKDWTTESSLKNATAALNLTSWLAKLDAVNTMFETKYVNRTHDTSNVPQQSFKQKRDDTIMAYYALRDVINSYMVIKKGAAPFARACNDINLHIEKYNSLKRSKSNATPVVPPSPSTPATNQ